MIVFVVLAVGVFMAMSTLHSQPPEALFVLLPDQDGAAGAIEVRNAAGTQLVDTANSGVQVGNRNTAPTAPAPVSEAAIQQLFSAVLAAEPPAPISLNLYFQSGTTELTSASQATFAELLTILETRTLPDISVIGHTDTLGPADVNEQLARQRADFIAQDLVSAGAPSDRMEITSHGETNLLINTADEIVEPLNRRVEVSIR